MRDLVIAPARIGGLPAHERARPTRLWKGCAGFARLLLGVAVFAWSPVLRAQAVSSFPEPDDTAPTAPAESGATERRSTEPQSKPPGPRQTAAPPVAPARGSAVTTPDYGSPAVNPPAASPHGLAFLPPVLDYREGTEVPPGYRLETTHNAGLVTGGLVTLGLAYAAGLTLALANDFENGATWLALPVAGPWAAIGARKVSCRVEPTGEDCLEVANSEIRTSTAMALDGLVQVSGAVLVLAGLFSQEKSLVRHDVAGFEVTPTLDASELGFLAKTRF